MSQQVKINIIGAGLAGCEAAYFLANKGFEVNLFEMRPIKQTGAHHSDKFAELVCSNSLKSKNLDNACGLLKEEIKEMGSILMESALINSVPGGNALTVDRDNFANYIDEKIRKHPNIHIFNEEVTELKEGINVVCSGPLTSESLVNELRKQTNENFLHFFDASAPIVLSSSINMDIAYKKARYDQGDDSYINCPMNREQYHHFLTELLGAKKALVHDFDTNYFEGCMPVEIIASRGVDTLRFGPLKPKGLRNPHDEDRTPYAVVQLRQDNVFATLYNIVGFQTNLTYGEQKRVFSLIPGLENAEFVRYGLMHRNTYVNAPSLLKADLSLKNNENIFIGGQLSGVEGYVESAATGLYIAYVIYAKLKGIEFNFPKSTILYSLINYIINANPKDFAPMNANFGIMYGVTKNNRLEVATNSLNCIKIFVRDYE